MSICCIARQDQGPRSTLHLLIRRLSMVLVGAIVVAGAIAPAGPARAIDHLLITEFAVTPSRLSAVPTMTAFA